MTRSFMLKVRNPQIPAGIQAGNYNINWSQPPFESSPDIMPTETTAVAYNGMAEAAGSFSLWYLDNQGPHGGQTSPLFLPVNGHTYIWDMQANTVTDTATAVSSSPPPRPQMSLDSLKQWAQANPVPAGGIAILTYLLLFGKRRLL